MIRRSRDTTKLERSKFMRRSYRDDTIYSERHASVFTFIVLLVDLQLLGHIHVRLVWDNQGSAIEQYINNNMESELLGFFLM